MHTDALTHLRLEALDAAQHICSAALALQSPRPQQVCETFHSEFVAAVVRVQYELYVSLQELYHGCTKGVQHTRRTVTELGEIAVEQHTLRVTVAPGTLDGTQYVFQG